MNLSVERLNVQNLLKGMPDTRWSKVLLRNLDHLPNESPLFFPTVDRELVILGDGYGEKLDFFADQQEAPGNMTREGNVVSQHSSINGALPCFYAYGN